jgi:hypothetical protein
MRTSRLGDARPALVPASCLALATAMLSAVALYDRCPLVDCDCGTHIASAASSEQAPLLAMTTVGWFRSPRKSPGALRWLPDGRADTA